LGEKIGYETEEALIIPCKEHKEKGEAPLNQLSYRKTLRVFSNLIRNMTIEILPPFDYEPPKGPLYASNLFYWGFEF